jgi:serine protease Do
MQTKTFKRTLIAAAVVAALAGLYGEFNIHPVTPAHALADTPAYQQSAAAPAAVAALPNFSAIAAQNGPAVVNISVTGTAKTGFASPFPQLDPDDPFYQFFRRFQMPRGEVPVTGLGSGFIINPDGVILTNAHVVDDATEVTVKLTDKREFRAKVLGIDKPSDIAVLKIDASGLPTVKLGDSSRTRVGDWVLAIGSPFGFENSATAGIVSAKSRSLPDDSYVPFIQTDVAVNPGNSGGPLFNLNGEVIGINSQIYSRSGGYQGLSFAIPINVAMKVEQQIAEHGKVSRGRLGVTIQEVNQSLADSFGLKKPMGALVSSVEKGGAADKAGMEPGDVILKFNGTEIGRSSELPPLVADLKPGSSAKMEVWRKGQTKEITASVGELKGTNLASAGGDVEKGRLGLAVRPLTSEERSESGVSGGLIVEDANGPAARAGIRSGDVVLALNGEPVTSTEQLRALVAKAGKHVALLIQRENTKIFVPINLG